MPVLEKAAEVVYHKVVGDLSLKFVLILVGTLAGTHIGRCNLHTPREVEATHQSYESQMESLRKEIETAKAAADSASKRADEFEDRARSLDEQLHQSLRDAMTADDAEDSEEIAVPTPDVPPETPDEGQESGSDGGEKDDAPTTSDNEMSPVVAPVDPVTDGETREELETAVTVARNDVSALRNALDQEKEKMDALQTALDARDDAYRLASEALAKERAEAEAARGRVAAAESEVRKLKWERAFVLVSSVLSVVAALK